MEIANRRPVPTRNRHWAQVIAKSLSRSSITANQLSVAGLVAAAVGAWLLLVWPSGIGLVLAAICIQLRLLCNMFDGMVAVEGNKKTANGILFNEIPDRLSDCLVIVAFGFACGYPWLGWVGALLACLTAYVRMLGGSLGFAQDFRGPMAKAHRMACLIAACLLGALETLWHPDRWALIAAAVVVVVGSAWTFVARVTVINSQLKAKAGS